MAVTARQPAWPVIYMLISTLERSALIINTELNISYHLKLNISYATYTKKLPSIKQEKTVTIVILLL